VVWHSGQSVMKIRQQNVGFTPQLIKTLYLVC
jgi:hypothetical protein